MKIVIGALAATLIMSPAVAQSRLSIENMLCPIDQLAEDESELVTESATSPDAMLSDQDVATLRAAVNACAESNGWSEGDAKREMDFVSNALSIGRVENKLDELGFVAGDFDSVLDDLNAADLDEVIAAGEQAEPVKQALAKMRAAKANSAEAEPYLTRYVLLAAKTKLIMFDMMANAG